MWWAVAALGVFAFGAIWAWCAYNWTHNRDDSQRQPPPPEPEEVIPPPTPQRRRSDPPRQRPQLRAVGKDEP